MKGLIRRLCLCWAVIMVAALLSFPAGAVTPIDPMRSSSLTLHYQHDGVCYEGIEVKTFRVAEVFADGSYALTGDFADYPVNIYGITSQTEWKNISSTLGAYAVADRLTPTRRSYTDNTGAVCFVDILPGMYLTLSVQIEEPQKITLFETFLTVVPHPSDSGDHNYDVTAYPKCQTFSPTPGETLYKVVKQWKDDGHASQRPASITVDILKDGVLQSTQQLSAKNNWCYTWSAPTDGSNWQAVERQIPSGYSVTVTKQDTTLLLTNTYDSDIPEPPPSGDTAVLWPYALAMCLSGGMILVLAIWRGRSGR